MGNLPPSGGAPSAGGGGNDLPTGITMEGGRLEMTNSFSSSRDVTLAQAGDFTVASSAVVSMSGIFSGTGNLIKRGVGTLVLSGANSYSGGTEITGGDLSIALDEHLGDIFSGVTLDGGTLTTTGGFFSRRDLLISGGDGAIRVDGAAVTWSGNFRGPGAFGKLGSGTLILSGSNTHSGGTTLSDGSLSVSADRSLGIFGGRVAFDGGTLVASEGFSSSRGMTLVSSGEFEVVRDPLRLSGVIEGAGSLEKSGSGTLILSEANTYSGGTTLSGGALSVSSDGNLGNSGAALTFNGGVLHASAPFSSSRNITLTGDGTVEVAVDSLTLSGAVSGSGLFTKRGDGILVLSGNNSNTGGVTVSEGAISISQDAHLGNSSSTLTLEREGTLRITDGFTSSRPLSFGATTGSIEVTGNPVTFSGVISGNGPLIKKGSGDLIFSGNNTYNGGNVLMEGRLSVDADDRLGDNASRLTFDGGTLFVSDDFTSSRDILLTGSGDIEIDTGKSLTLSGNMSGTGFFRKRGSGTLVLSGDVDHEGVIHLIEGTLSVSQSRHLGRSVSNLILSGGTLVAASGFNSPKSVLLQGDGTVEVGAGDTLSLSGVIGGAGSLVKTGSGVLSLGGFNTYSGRTVLEGGYVEVEEDRNLGASSAQLHFDGGILRAAHGFSSQRDVSLMGTGEIEVATDPLTLSGTLSGTGSLKISGAGSLVLRGANTYSGGTLLSGGSLSVGVDANLGASSGSLTFDGGALVATDSFSSTRDGSFTDDGKIGVTSGSLTLSGVFSGAGALVKQGSGTLVFSGTNTYSGGTTISEGALSIGADANLGNASSSLSLGDATLIATAGFTSARSAALTGRGVIEVDDGLSLTLSGVLSGAGSLTKRGTGTLVLSGSNTYAGGTTCAEGVLSVNANAHLGDTMSDLLFDGGTLLATTGFTSTRDVSLLRAGGTIQTSVGIPLTFTGTLSGAGSLTKTGVGTLILGAANSYSGGTVITGGFLSVALDQNLGEPFSNVTLDGGTLVTTGGLVSRRDISILAGDGAIQVDGAAVTMLGNLRGPGAFGKLGLGTLILSGTNTHSGGTTLSDGRLSVSADRHLGGFDARMAFDGGTLVASEGFSSFRGITLVSSGEIEVLKDPLRLSGVLEGTGSLTKRGSGTLVLSAANTYSGGTTLSEGALSISSDDNLGNSGAALTFNGGVLHASASFNSSRNVALTGDGAVEVEVGSLTLSGIVSGSGLFTKRGDGTLVLSGNNTHTGGVTVSAGVLSIAQDVHLGNSSSTLTLEREGTVRITNGFTSSRPLSFGATTGSIEVTGNPVTFSGVVSGNGPLIKKGSGDLILSGNNTYNGGNVLMEGRLSVDADTRLGNSASSLTFEGGTLLVSDDFTSARAILLNGSGDVEIKAGKSLTLSGDTSGTGSFRKRGSGTLILTGDGNHEGATHLLAGILSVSQSQNLGRATSNLIFSGGTLLATSGFTSPKAVLLQGDGTIQVGSGDTLNLVGVISGNGSLVKTGSGVLTLGGSNSYLGRTLLQGGYLEVEQDRNLGAFSAQLHFDGGTLRAAHGFTSQRDVSLTGHGEIDVATDSLTLSGILSGVGSLKKSGAGRLILQGVNTYSGGTTLSGGEVAVAMDAHLGSRSSSITFDGGALVATASFSSARDGSFTGNGEIGVEAESLTLSGVFSGVGALVKTGPGTLICTGNNTYAGGTTISEGVLSIGADTHLGSASSSLSLGDATLLTTAGFTSARSTSLTGRGVVEVSANSSLTLSGVLSGSGSLSKRGTGTLVLSGNNTYAGGTTFAAGVVSVNANVRLGNAASTLVFDGGTLLATSGFTSTRDVSLLKLGGTIETPSGALLVLTGAVSGMGALTKTGAGTLIVSGGNSYEGGTAITGGFLSVALDQNLGDVFSSITLDGGTLTTTGGFVSRRDISILDGDGAIQVDGAEVTVLGNLRGPGAFGKLGSGTLILAGTNTHSGGTTLASGKLSVAADRNLGGFNARLAFDGGTLVTSEGFSSPRGMTLVSSGEIEVLSGPLHLSGVLDGTGSLTKRGSGMLILSGTNTYSGGTTLSGGALSISSDDNLGNSGASLTFDGGILRATDRFSSSRSISLSSAGQIEVAQSSLTWSGALSGVGMLTKSGPGDLILSASNTYSGGTTLLGGRLAISRDDNLGNGASALTFDGGALRMTSGFTSARSIAFNGIGEIEITGSDVTLSGVLSGSGGYIKSGSGTLILSGNNTHTGTIHLNAGSLSVSADRHLGDTSSLLHFQGGTLEVTSDFASTRAATITHLGNIEVASSKSLTLSGVITGSGDVKKSGPGTLILKGGNTYVGRTVLSEGSLSVESDQNLGNVASRLLFEGGTLVATRGFASIRGVSLSQSGTIEVVADPLSLLGTLSGSGSLTKSGSGSLILEGANIYTGNTILSGGSLIVSQNSNLGDIASDLEFNGGTLTVMQGFTSKRAAALTGSGEITVHKETLIFSGILSGSGAFTKSGQGTLVLDQANTHSGGMTLSEGRISASEDANLGNSAASLTFDGGILQVTRGFTSSRNLSLSRAGEVEVMGEPLTLSGVLSGTGPFRKSGPGDLILSGLNTYSGGTALVQGRLSISQDAHLGGAISNLTFDGGALLATAGFTSSRSATLASSGEITVSGSGNTLTLSGVFSGAGSLKKSGLGSLILSGANTYSGGTTLAEGSISVSQDTHLGSNSSSLTFDGGALIATSGFTSIKTALLNGLAEIQVTATPLTLSGVLSGRGHLRKTGSGTLVLSGVNTHSGGTTLAGGHVSVASDYNLGDAASYLTFDGGALRVTRGFVSLRHALLVGTGEVEVMSGSSLTLAGILSGTGSLTKSGAGTLILSEHNGYDGGTFLSGGILSVSRDANLGTHTSDLTFNGGTLLATRGFISSRNGALAGSGEIRVTGEPLTLSGIFSGVGALTKSGAGTLVLSGVNTYSGGTLLSGGFLSVAADNNLGNSGSDVTFDRGGLIASAGFTSARSFTLTGAGEVKVIKDALELSGAITDVGALTKTGMGTLVLSGANTYTGGTLLSEGVLSVSSDGHLGGSASTLTFDGGTLRATSGFTSSRSASFTSSGHIQVMDTPLTMSGVFSGTGFLTKIGSGTLILSGNNTYSGGTTFEEGRLSVSADGHLGDSSASLTFDGGILLSTSGFSSARDVSLTSSGTIEVTGTPLTMSGIFRGKGPFIKMGVGTLVLSGINAHTGGMHLVEGVVSVARDRNLGDLASSLTFDGGTLLATSGFRSARQALLVSTGTVQVTGSPLTLSGVIGGLGSLTKSGAGTLVLSGDNDYEGGTTLLGGYLDVSEDHNLGYSFGALTFNGGILRATRGFSSVRNASFNGVSEIDVVTDPLIMSGILGQSGSLKKSGLGTLVLTGVNTYSGGTALAAGRVSVSADHNLGDLSSDLTFEGGILRSTEGFTSARDAVLTNPGEVEVIGDPLTMSGVFSGSGSLTKSARGTLVLSGINTYTGLTHFKGGHLSVSANHNLGDSSSNLNFDGGALRASSGFTSARDALLTGPGEVEVIGSPLTMSGVLSGSGSLTKSGEGILVLSGVNTYTGTTHLIGGHLSVSQDRNLGALSSRLHFQTGALRSTSGFTSDRRVAITTSGEIEVTGGPLKLTGVVSGTGDLEKSGAGILALDGDNTYIGTTLLSEGTLSVFADKNLGDVASNLTFHGGTLRTTGGFASMRQSLLKGDGTIEVMQEPLTLFGTINGSGSLSKKGVGMLMLRGTNTYTGKSILSEGRLNVVRNDNLGDVASDIEFDGGTLWAAQGFVSARKVFLTSSGEILVTDSPLELSGVFDGSGVLTKSGMGTLVLSGHNHHDGGMILSEGRVSVAEDVNLGNLSATLTFDGGILRATKGFTSVRHAFLTASGEIEVTGTSVTLSGVLGGTGSLTKSGVGTLVLTGPNTYSGGTILSGGHLSVAEDRSLGDSVSDLIFAGGALRSTQGFTSSRNAALNGDGEVEVIGDPLTLSGTFSGSGSLKKSGTGTLILSGANTHSGGTSLSGGTLEVATDESLGAQSALLTFNGGVLHVTSGFTSSRDMSLRGSGTIDVKRDALTLSGLIGGQGSMTKLGAGTLVLQGRNTYTGRSILSEGRLDVSADHNLGGDRAQVRFHGGVLNATKGFTSYRSGFLTAEGVVEVTQAPLTWRGTLNGSGFLTKTGPGTLILTAENGHTGGVTVSAGWLQVSADHNLGDRRSNITFDGGGLRVSRSFTSARQVFLEREATIHTHPHVELLMHGAFSKEGALIKQGEGTLTLTGVNTYTGKTVIDGGILTLADQGTLGAGTHLFVDTGQLVIAKEAGTKKIREISGGGSGINLNDNTFEIGEGTFSGVIVGKGGSLKKAGKGTLTLSGMNTYTGGTSIDAGVLSVSSDSNLGDQLGDLTFDRSTLLVTHGFESSRKVFVKNRGTIDVQASQLTLLGVIDGIGSLFKEGSGTLTLRAINLYEGGTTVASGILEGNTDSIKGPLINNAKVIFDQQKDATYPDVMSGSGTLIKRGSGTLTLKEIHSYEQHTIVEGGHLKVVHLSLGEVHLRGGNLHLAPKAGKKTIAALHGEKSFFNLNDNELEVHGGHFSGAIVGLGATLTKVGDRTLHLSGINTHTGGTHVKAGILSVSADGSLGHKTGALHLQGGTLLATASFSSARNTFLVKNSAIDVKLSAALTMNGVLSGDGGIAKKGEGSLTLSAFNTFTGKLSIEEGTLHVASAHSLGQGQLRLGGGTLFPLASMAIGKEIFVDRPSQVHVDPTVHLTLSAPLKGKHTLRKIGTGLMSVSGDSSAFSGKMDVDQGTLAVIGVLGGPLDVGFAATVIGTGQVGFLRNHGKISPGLSIGTLKVKGDYIQDHFADLELEADDVSSASSRLAVSGAAHIGGFVTLKLKPGLYEMGKTYHLLTAKEVKGRFRQLVLAHDLGFSLSGLSSVELKYFPNLVSAHVTKTRAVLPVQLRNLTGNAQVIAGELLSLLDAPSEDFKAVVRGVTRLSFETFPRGIEQLGPQQFGALALSCLESNTRIAQEMNRVQAAYVVDELMNSSPETPPAARSHRAAWVAPLYYYDKQNEKDGQTPFINRTHGLTTGYQQQLLNALFLSAGAAYSHSDIGWQQGRGYAEIDSVYVSPSLGIRGESGYAGIVVSAARSFYAVDRKIRLPGISKDARNKHRSLDILTGFSGALKFKLSKAHNPLFFLPTVGLDYLNIFEKGYREQGADSMNLTVESVRSTFFRLDAKLHLLRKVALRFGDFLPSLYVGWLKTIPITQGCYKGKWREQTGDHAPFNVQSYHSSTDQAILGADFSFAYRDHCSFKLKYEANLGKNHTVQEAKMSFNWNF